MILNEIKHIQVQVQLHISFYLQGKASHFCRWQKSRHIYVLSQLAEMISSHLPRPLSFGNDSNWPTTNLLTSPPRRYFTTSTILPAAFAPQRPFETSFLLICKKTTSGCLSRICGMIECKDFLPEQVVAPGWPQHSTHNWRKKSRLLASVFLDKKWSSLETYEWPTHTALTPARPAGTQLQLTWLISWIMNYSNIQLLFVVLFQKPIFQIRSDTMENLWGMLQQVLTGHVPFVSLIQ